ncbi:hypothetical protein [Brevundimonas denitrificans]|uniref:hypothetical protein n=1 Tax=Brevundimonas denitrificans TaxID=1443434 RepID=UPI00223B3A35|nr:hypothetical protein [Brevundimonas denitrificans]
MELPAALQRAGRNQALHDLLSDRGFVLAKCRLNQSDDLIGDFGRLAGERTGRLAAIEDLLRRSAHLLRRGRPAWPADGILIQVALERPPEDPARRVFEPVSALGKAQALWLRRTWPGSGGARSVLEGHEDEVLGFIAADEDRGLTWSADGTIRLWGLRDGDCRRVLSAPGRQAEDVWLVDAAVIFAWSEAGITAWDMRSGRPLVDAPAPEGRAWLAAARWRDQAVLLAEDGSLHAAPLNPPGPAEAIAPPAEGAPPRPGPAPRWSASLCRSPRAAKPSWSGTGDSAPCDWTVSKPLGQRPDRRAARSPAQRLPSGRPGRRSCGLGRRFRPSRDQAGAVARRGASSPLASHPVRPRRRRP